ncbi:hypothetical protein CTI14_44855, partial [Methylobacterium radiotolerans]
MELRSRQEQGHGAGQYGTQRGRLQATINQNLPAGYGSLHFTGSTQDYWDRPGRDTQIQAAYSNSYKRVNYSVSATRQLNVGTQKWDNQVMLNLGIPLGRNHGTEIPARTGAWCGPIWNAARPSAGDDQPEPAG